MAEKHTLQVHASSGCVARFRTRAVRGAANKNIRLHSRSLPVSLCYGLGERFRISPPHQIDGASAKTASGHPAADVPRQTFSAFDHSIEFRAADLIQVAQAFVRGVHQTTDTRQIARVE